MIKSIPVACSSARIFLPSRPIIRPLISSLGNSTTETVVSATWSEASLCTAMVISFRASSSACDFTLSSIFFTSRAASILASSIILFFTSSRAFSAV